MADIGARRHVLLVAATEAELCGRAGLVCGVGPVEAAAVTAAALAAHRPDAVLHVGIAGGCGLELGAVVIGTASMYGDIRAAVPTVSRVEPSGLLMAAAARALPEARPAPIRTSAAVGASDKVSQADVVVEAMEGFGVLRACALAGVPAVEVRVISNEIGEEDRARWDIPGALAVLAQVLPALVASITDEKSASP
jgi:futalosine hydrolase